MCYTIIGIMCYELHNDELQLLKEPTANLKTHRDRAFSVYAPKLWNTLPLHLRQASSVDCFKDHLKTFLFNRAFDHCSCYFSSL